LVIRDKATGQELRDCIVVRDFRTTKPGVARFPAHTQNWMGKYYVRRVKILRVSSGELTVQPGFIRWYLPALMGYATQYESYEYCAFKTGHKPQPFVISDEVVLEPWAPGDSHSDSDVIFAAEYTIEEYGDHLDLADPLTAELLRLHSQQLEGIIGYKPTDPDYWHDLRDSARRALAKIKKLLAECEEKRKRD